MNESTDFSASIAIVVDLIKKLRDSGVNGPALLVAINDKINDETLFTKAQRPNVLKAVNKSLGTRYSISAVKRAAKEKAVHVDELHGTATLNNQETTMQQSKLQQALDESKAKLLDLLGDRDEVARGLVYEDFLIEHSELEAQVTELVGQIGVEGSQLNNADDVFTALLAMNDTASALFQRFIAERQKPVEPVIEQVAEQAPEPVTPVATEPAPAPAAEVIAEPVAEPAPVVKAERVRNIDRPFSKDEQTAQPTIKSEEVKMNTVAQEVPFAGLVERIHATRSGQAQPQQSIPAAEQPKALTPAEYEEILQQAGATTPQAVEALKDALFKEHPALQKEYLDSTVGLAAGGTQVRLGGWVTASVQNSMLFMQFAKKQIEAKAQPEEDAESGVMATVMTTLRGDRKEGFSSGVVAAAAAVLGGGIEMAVRGNLSAGSVAGVALGATASYFAANAVEDVMESETGRYLLSGSIGLVVGGLSSRAGSIVQTSMQMGVHGDDVAKALPDLHRPTGTLAAPANVDMSKLFR